MPVGSLRTRRPSVALESDSQDRKCRSDTRCRYGTWRERHVEKPGTYFSLSASFVFFLFFALSVPVDARGLGCDVGRVVLGRVRVSLVLYRRTCHKSILVLHLSCMFLCRRAATSLQSQYFSIIQPGKTHHDSPVYKRYCRTWRRV